MSLKKRLESPSRPTSLEPLLSHCISSVRSRQGSWSDPAGSPSRFNQGLSPACGIPYDIDSLLVPSGKRLQKTMERSTMFHGKINYKWQLQPKQWKKKTPNKKHDSWEHQGSWGFCHLQKLQSQNSRKQRSELMLDSSGQIMKSKRLLWARSSNHFQSLLKSHLAVNSIRRAVVSID